MGLGAHLIHMSIFNLMYKESPEYQIQPGLTVRRVFETPARIEIDPVSKGLITGRGTEDLPWYGRIIEEEVLKRAGWPKIAKQKYPFLCDTSLFCRHIDQNGMRFPSKGEDQEFK